MLESKPRAIYLSPGDPTCSPRGGQTAFAIQALNALGSKLALVAPCENPREDAPIGQWRIMDWHGVKIWRFNIGSYAPENKSRRPLVPRRLILRRRIAKYLPAIREIPTRNLICDSPEVLGVLKRYSWESFCYRFAGLNNPVEVSRYPYLRPLSGYFHHKMTRDLVALRPAALLASADRETIARFAQENRRVLGQFPIHFFPTRYDPDVFYPGDSHVTSQALGWQNFFPRIVLVGRLCWVKGWELALEIARILRQEFPRTLMTFIGDGEDRVALQRRIVQLGLTENVRLEGFLPPSETRKRIVAADVYLSASYREGWSVAFTEALACGAVCVTTNVSGAMDLVDNNSAGRALVGRDPKEFARVITELVKDPAVMASLRSAAIAHASKFSSRSLAEDWGKIWNPLR
ncbi:MAG: glycosyltransferase family 4 protein [Planctomycetia bacterium]|nr:glycosyltransferase family 4 protein [Planctomycetia bacterium]